MRARALSLLLCAPLLAACGAQSSHPVASAPNPSALGMHKEQIAADYLWVAVSADKGKSPMPQVGGTQYGVVVALPPGYPAVPGGGKPDGSWTVYLSQPQKGKQNLLQGARRVAALPRAETDVTLVGVTGPYALFTAQSAGTRSLQLLRVAGSGQGGLRTLGALGPGYGNAIAVRGMVLYLGPHNTLHVLRIASQRTSVVRDVPKGALFWRQGAVYVDNTKISQAGLSALPAPRLPAGFRWISVVHATAPIAAVPQNYTVQENSGGSSQGVSATDPKDPAQQVSVYSNACAGCYNPGIMAPGVNTLSTPIYIGSAKGTTPLGDHGFLSVTPQKGGLVGYQLVVDYLNGGDLEAAVTVRRGDGALAREILGTVRLPW
ncbi:MAG: hypothetical protein M0Z66_12170 [Thermaerobacter sp.]|nr:hypothetical protein [Thermaerobacter sp.]